MLHHSPARARRLAALVFPALVTMMAAAGCAASTDSPGGDPNAAPQDEALSSKNKYAKWIYNGPLPALDSTAEPITMTVSQKAHTLLVTGVLPKSVTGELP